MKTPFLIFYIYFVNACYALACVDARRASMSYALRDTPARRSVRAATAAEGAGNPIPSVPKGAGRVRKGTKKTDNMVDLPLLHVSPVTL